MSDQKPSGCAFLIDEVGSENIFTPEDFTEDQRMFAKTAETFMNKEVFPIIDELEDKNFDKMVGLLKKAADVGLLMIDIPEKYGGLEVDKTTSMIVTEYLSKYSGWATTYGAHTGIGMLPLLYFGTHEQRQKWLPEIATADSIAAYALTEPGSGSDALAAKTKAELTDDGDHYVLNGTKMWITNAGFADLFTVFAQVEGDKFTAFLVEADRDGVEPGEEEEKMGLRGSSTRELQLEDVKIPADNLLGEIGKGHKIAFNILNIGRFKLGVGSLGGAKRVMKVAAKYAQQREQFGQPIAEFGAIRSKLAQMAYKLYSLETMCYRVSGYMDRSLELLDDDADDYPERVMEEIEEFAIEDSIMKVYGSEVLDYCADEALQIHGGMGYSTEYEVERVYRDSRINRIFEGTNEINRMLIPGLILKRTMKGQLDLFEQIQKVEMALAEGERPTPPPRDDDPELAFEQFVTEQSKKIGIYCANQAIQKHMADLRERQEILIDLADIISQLYVMDSTVGRTLQLVDERGFEKTEVHRAATRLALADAYDTVRHRSERLLYNLAEGDELNSHLQAFEKLTFHHRIDVIDLWDTVADAVLAQEKYPF